MRGLAKQALQCARAPDEEVNVSHISVAWDALQLSKIPPLFWAAVETDVTEKLSSPSANVQCGDAVHVKLGVADEPPPPPPRRPRAKAKGVAQMRGAETLNKLRIKCARSVKRVKRLAAQAAYWKSLCSKRGGGGPCE